MGYDTRKNDEGLTVVMPLELPMFDGPTSTMGAQALRDLASFLRHQASCETILDNFDINEPEIFDLYQQESAQMATKLVSTFMALASCADNLGIDIMQEIWEMPWEV